MSRQNEAPKRWTIAVDVDGVLHPYTSGWQGADVLPDPPVPGAIEWLEMIVEHYDVAICSTRAASLDGRVAIRKWLRDHGLSEAASERITIEDGKPPALVYVDDRAYRFDGSNWPTPTDIKYRLQPWWWHGAKS